MIYIFNFQANSSNMSCYNLRSSSRFHGQSSVGETRSPVQKLLLDIEDELSQKPRQHEAAINQLPDSILVEIISHSLDQHEGCGHNNIMQSVRLTCKRWFLLCRDRAIWKHFRARNTLRCGSKINRQCLSALLRYAIGIGGLAVNIQSVPDIAHLIALSNEIKYLFISLFSLQHEMEYVQLFEAMKRYCPKLSHLDISGWIFNTPKKCESFNMIRNLKALTLVCSDLEDPCLATVLENAQKLETLELKEPMLTLNSMTIIARKSHLNTLLLHEPKLSYKIISRKESGLIVNREMESLENLTIKCPIFYLVKESCLVSIADNLINLKQLDLTENVCLTAIGIYHIVKNLKKLQIFVLDKTNCDDDGLQYVCQYCYELKVLAIFSCTRLGQKPFETIFSNKTVFSQTLTKLFVSELPFINDYFTKSFVRFSVSFHPYN